MRTQTIKTSNRPMTNDELRAVAPSIFAASPWERMSSRYAFIPTISVVEKLRENGLMPFEVGQVISRASGRADYAKHMIRFRDMRENALSIPSLGGVTPELVLFNSHDGGCIYKLVGGLIRGVCLNMAVFSDANFATIAVRHTGNVDDIIDASFSVVEDFPKAIEMVEQFAQRRLTAPQQEAFAAAALDLKYDPGTAPVTPAALVAPTRDEDADPTLWNTFNVVQEKLINGGLRGRNTSTGRRLRTRAVTGITENTRLNQALWTLTEKMKDLVG